MEISDCIFRSATRGITVTAGATANIRRTVFTDLGRAVFNLWNTNTILKNVTIDSVDYAFSLYDSIIFAYNSSMSRSGCVAQLRGGSLMHDVRGSNCNVCSCTQMTEPSSDGSYPQILIDNLYEEHPMFVDPDAPDYHLQAGSPLIDLGIDVGLPYCGSYPDIGAYEFITPGCTPPSPYETVAYPVNLLLPESYVSTPLPEYRDEGERQRNALHDAVMGVIDDIDGIDQSMPVQQQIDAFVALRDRLEQQVLSRADGYYGGNPSDDWVTTRSEQYNVVTRVDMLIERIDARINALMALTR
jgi:hypothetical protein